MTLPMHPPAPNGVTLSTVVANGITHRLATSGRISVNKASMSSSKNDMQDNSPGDSKTCNLVPPLIMLLHGFPESWYSYRHQLIALADAGYGCCAPDMRGYGGPDAPSDVQDYTLDILAGDVIAIAHLLGYQKFIVIGHDMGAYLAWHVSLMFPEAVLGVVGMSVPYAGHSPKKDGLLSTLRQHHGDSLEGSDEEKSQSKFQYILHHNLPNAAKEYDRNGREFLYRLYAYTPGVDCEEKTPEVTDKRMFVPGYGAEGNKEDANGGSILDIRGSPGWWARLPRPKSLPHWLSPYDFAYYASEFDRSGFSGALAWYCAMDLNWMKTRHLRGHAISQPCLFLGGDQDMVIWNSYGGTDAVESIMKENCNSLRGCVIFTGGGHWIQQEMASEVNRELLLFLYSLQMEGTFGPQSYESHVQSRL
mmetsp:Transcript_7306/g.13107  ORF Transcript_7306/g.13107 Transcript_7306/m.13107 type:complete len:419 (-) Transcript_7306:1195-2451(-)|eukprot:CAMPEP_0198287530 /NCGR_PEP_ID=MMETSP1449-20131203/6302_1 /TAXON_ID=420275 /ORGANISM="Attheya septentrionalis, Strain CCMP2084" /LENGTH=418 /DNA_ID=CAMNT_0043985491 /DNA_START=95 /DNA_END=1351 /DNA_ORIENTATION=-